MAGKATKKKRGPLTLRRKNMIYGLIFICPWAIGFLLFFAKYLLQTIQFSFSRLIILPEGGYTLTFNNITNYIAIFTRHATFNRTLAESVQSLLVDLVLIIVFSLIMAVMLNTKFRGRALTRAIFFLPVIMASPAIAAGIDSAMVIATGGVSIIPADIEAVTNVMNARFIIGLLIDVGVPESVVMYILGAIDRIYTIIRMSGVQIIIFLAALQSVSGSLYEVAKIEGATGYEAFFEITLPIISPMVLTNVFYTIIDSYIGSPIVTMAYDTAFKESNYGMSAAMSLISALSVGAVLGVFGWVLNKFIYYQN
jgi:ABC-type sugar transport system permease subunit